MAKVTTSDTLGRPTIVATHVHILICLACGSAIKPGGLCSFDCKLDATERPAASEGLAVYALVHVLQRADACS